MGPRQRALLTQRRAEMPMQSGCLSLGQSGTSLGRGIFGRIDRGRSIRNDSMTSSTLELADLATVDLVSPLIPSSRRETATTRKILLVLLAVQCLWRSTCYSRRSVARTLNICNINLTSLPWRLLNVSGLVSPPVVLSRRCSPREESPSTLLEPGNGIENNQARFTASSDDFTAKSTMSREQDRLVVCRQTQQSGVCIAI